MRPNENKISDGWRGGAWLRVEGGISWKVRNRACQPFAYVSGVDISVSLESGLRGQFWFNCFRSAESLHVRHRPLEGALDAEQTC